MKGRWYSYVNRTLVRCNHFRFLQGHRCPHPTKAYKGFIDPRESEASVASWTQRRESNQAVYQTLWRSRNHLSAMAHMKTAKATLIEAAEALHRKVHASLPWGLRLGHLLFNLRFAADPATFGKFSLGIMLMQGVEGLPRRSEERRVGKEGRSRWTPY